MKEYTQRLLDKFDLACHTLGAKNNPPLTTQYLEAKKTI